jgi:hypothetical protein
MKLCTWAGRHQSSPFPVISHALPIHSAHHLCAPRQPNTACRETLATPVGQPPPRAPSTHWTCGWHEWPFGQPPCSRARALLLPRAKLGPALISGRTIICPRAPCGMPSLPPGPHGSGQPSSRVVESNPYLSSRLAHRSRPQQPYRIPRAWNWTSCRHCRSPGWLGRRSSLWYKYAPPPRASRSGYPSLSRDYPPLFPLKSSRRGLSHSRVQRSDLPLSGNLR